MEGEVVKRDSGADQSVSKGDECNRKMGGLHMDRGELGCGRGERGGMKREMYKQRAVEEIKGRREDQHTKKG